MLCYIKDFYTFETIAKYDAVEYSLADGINSSVTIYQKDAVELTTKYVGCWMIISHGFKEDAIGSYSYNVTNSSSGGLVIDITGNQIVSKETIAPSGGSVISFSINEKIPRQYVYYISGASPNDDSITLTMQHPIYAFERAVHYEGETTYGELIYDVLTNDYGSLCPDAMYALNYLDVTNTDATECDIETDNYGYFVPSEIFEEARKFGVKIDFSLTETNRLAVSISTANYETGVVIFDDGHNKLDSESYDASYCAKATVIHELEDEDPENITYEVIDFYLSEDHHISTTPPENRAKGAWKIYNAYNDESPLSVAVGAFSGNSDNHKIEFYSDKYFEYYQPIKIRLRNEVLDTIVASRSVSRSDERYKYICGRLATTLTEKVDSANKIAQEEVTKTVKNINKAISSQVNELNVAYGNSSSQETFDGNNMTIYNYSGSIYYKSYINIDKSSDGNSASIYGRIRFENSARTGANPGVYVQTSLRPSSTITKSVCGFTSDTLAEVVYLVLDTNGRLYVLVSETYKNAPTTAGVINYTIMPTLISF